MTKFERFKKEIEQLYTLAMLQRSLRLGLRAFWLGLAGVMVSWGANMLWGWLPYPVTWVLVGFGFSLLPMAAILVSLFVSSPDQDWVWKLDRSMGLQEQFSTAWEVAQKRQRGMLNHLLVHETLTYMPQARKVVLKDGWFRRMDIIAASVLTPLALLMLFSLLSPQPPVATNDPPVEVPPRSAPPIAVETDPEQAQTEPEDAAGDQGQAEEGDGNGGEGGDGEGEPAGNQSGQDQPDSSSAPVSGPLSEALRDLGADLSRQAGTYELGQALENLDLPGAADALEDLQDELDRLSPESRENLEQALREAAESVDQAGEQALAQDLSEAADSLDQSPVQDNEALDQVADDLRQLAGGQEAGQSAGGGSGAGEGGGGETGLPEPLPRLHDESGDFSLPIEALSDPSLLSPAPPGEVGNGTASGSLDATGGAGEEAFQSPLLPSSFQWKWREIIGEYFSR